jgi:hypothetical protein
VSRGSDRDGGTGSVLPAGYVEQAVADLLAGGRGEPLTRVPFSNCPGCGAGLTDTKSFVQEYWVANETRFLAWCHECGGTFTVVPVERFEGTEATE